MDYTSDSRRTLNLRRQQQQHRQAARAARRRLRRQRRREARREARRQQRQHQQQQHQQTNNSSNHHSRRTSSLGRLRELHRSQDNIRNNSLSDRFNGIDEPGSGREAAFRAIRSGDRIHSDNRSYLLRAVRVEDPSLPTQDQPQQQQPRILAPDQDIFGVYLGHKFKIFNDISVKGQSKTDRWHMVRVLRSLGLLDGEAYPTVRDFVDSLVHLYRRTDIISVTDARLFSFLVKGLIKEGSFDFLQCMVTYDRILAKLHAPQPEKDTPYFRDGAAVIAEWP